MWKIYVGIFLIYFSIWSRFMDDVHKAVYEIRIPVDVDVENNIIELLSNDMSQ